MCLLEKSDLSWKLGQRLEREGHINHSAHHAYYSILQLLKHIVLRANWATEYELDDHERGSTHNQVINNVYSNLSGDLIAMNLLKRSFLRAKRVRVEADYGSEDITPARRQSLNDSCIYVKEYCDEHLCQYY